MARTLRLICIGLMMGVMAIGPGCHLIHSWQRSQWDEDCFMFQYALPGKAESEAQEFVLAKLGDVVVSMRFSRCSAGGMRVQLPGLCKRSFLNCYPRFQLTKNKKAK